MERQFIHPELQKDEVLLKNMSDSSFNALKFSSKRIGRLSYDGRGNRQFENDWHPVFISIAELESQDQTLMEIRRELVSKGL